MVGEEVDARCSHLRRGWYWGTPEFAKQILRLGQQAIERGRDRGYRASLERRAHGETRAEELLQAGLTAANLTVVQARHLPGSEWREVAVARVIWENTAVSQRWLAEQLGMSSAANVSQQLRRNFQRPDRRRYPASFKKWLASVKK